MTITPFPASSAHLPVPSDRDVTDTMAETRSEATRRVYRSQWRLFTAWADEAELPSMPASPATVAWYLVSRHRAGASATAVGQAHRVTGLPSPVADEAARLTIAGIAHTDYRSQYQATPLDAAALDAIIAAAKRPRVGRRGILETPDYAEKRGAVDIALVLLVSDAGLRRSAAAALAWSDVVRWPDWSGRITVRRSKPDPTSAGAVVYATPQSIHGSAGRYQIR